MTIEWAPISVDGSRDPAVRRHARSLAMRQFRQRQKEELFRRNTAASEDTAAECSTIPKRKSPRTSGPPAINVNVKRRHNESRATSSVFNAVSWRDTGEERMQDPKVIANSLMLCKRCECQLSSDDAGAYAWLTIGCRPSVAAPRSGVDRCRLRYLCRTAEST